MGRVRQLPRLYARGSLANVTMTGLTDDQQAHIKKIVDRVANHPELVKPKHKVMKQYQITIGGDYLDDRATAEQEYLIAVWRGVVSLFYHRDYVFKCRCCGSSTYNTRLGRSKPIDRASPECPNCGAVEITEAAGTNLLEYGQFAAMAYIQEVTRDIPDGVPQPTYKSPIDPIAGDLRYADPQKVIDDPTQLKRFFSEYVYNYYRQQIAENKRAEHKFPLDIVGRADEIIVEEILNLCTKLGIKHNYCAKTQPENGKYTIKLMGLLTPPEFTAELSHILEKAAENKITIVINQTSLAIVTSESAPIIKASVIKPVHATTLDNVTDSDGNVSDHAVTQASYKTVRGYRMDSEDHVQSVSNTEALTHVRDVLPDGDCQAIFDLYMQDGPTFEEFTKMYGGPNGYPGKPRLSHIANFLQITSRKIKSYQEMIRLACLANSLLPANMVY